MRNFIVALFLIAFTYIIAITENFLSVLAWIVSNHKLEIAIILLIIFGIYKIYKTIEEKNNLRNSA